MVLMAAVALASAACGTGRLPSARTEPPATMSTPQPTAPDATCLAAAPSFTPVTIAGDGNRTVPWPLGEGIPTLLTFTCDAAGNVSVTALDRDGRQQDLLVSAAAPYSGTTLVGLRHVPASVQVAAAGHWTLNLAPLATASRWDGASTFTHAGDDVVALAEPPATDVAVRVTNSSVAIFTLVASTPAVDSLLVDEAGDYRGTVTIPAGAVLLTIHSDGSWSLAPR